MKTLYTTILAGFLILTALAGCIRVQTDEELEETQNTETVEVPDPSEATIVSDDYSFSVSWTKNSEFYGQLEITDDYTTSKGVIAVITAGTKEVNLNCEYRRDIDGEKEYRCQIENADKIGSFYARFKYERELLVLERSGTQSDSAIAVLTQFYIYESHGKEK